MSETIRYSRLGKEDLNLGTSTFEARLADGRVVTLSQIDLGAILSDPALSSQSISISTLALATISVSGVAAFTGTLQLPEKSNPSIPLSGELWINPSGTILEYADDAGTPTRHEVVGNDTVQTLTNKTLTSPAITTPIVTGTQTGTYVFGGTPSLGVALDAAGQDITSLDEVAFNDAAANPSTAGRLRRSGTNLLWNDGTTPKVIALRDAIETLSNKTLASPIISGTVTGTYTLGGTPTLPATAGSSLVFIESLTLGSDNIVNSLGSIYDEHIFQLIDVLPGTNNSDLLLTMSIDNGANFVAADYEWSLRGTTTSSATSIKIFASALNTVAHGGINGWIRIIKPHATSKHKHVLFSLSGVNQTVITDSIGVGRSTSTSPIDSVTNAVDAIKIAFNSGTISGTLRHYGVKNS